MKKKLISSVMSVLMLLTLVPMTSAFDLNQEDTALIVDNNQTSLQSEALNALGLNATIFLKDDVSADNLDGYEKIILEESSMDKSIQESLQEAFNKSAKIFVLGDLTSNQLRDYLGLEIKASNKSAMLPNNIDNPKLEETVETEKIGRVVDVSKFPDIGKVVYQDWRGTNITNVSQDMLKNVLLPEISLHKQLEIVKKLDVVCAEIDNSLLEKNTQRDILCEYKKSLIYEYVTGKKEVI